MVMGVTLKNTTTDEMHRFPLDGHGTRLSPGSYVVTSTSSTLPATASLSGQFSVRRQVNEQDAVTSVQRVPLQTVSPYRETDPNWLVVEAQPPFGHYPLVRLVTGPKYAIGLIVDTRANRTGLLLSMLLGLGVTSPEEYTKAELFIYENDESTTRTAELCLQFLVDSAGIPNRAIITGVTTGEFLTAQKVLPPDVMMISLGSTYSDYSQILPNAISMDYSDAITTRALVLGMLYNRQLLSPVPTSQNIYIVAFLGSLFSDGYIQDFLNALTLAPDGVFNVAGVFRYPAGDTVEMNRVLQAIASEIQPNDILVYVGNSLEVDETTKLIFENDFPPSVFAYLADTMDDVNYNFPNQKAYVVTCSFMNYTSATRQLYIDLFSLDPTLIQLSSYLCPFAYDATRQLDFLVSNELTFTLADFAQTITSGRWTKAVLDTNWVTPTAHRPQYGLFWFTQTYDTQWSNSIIDFNRISLGTQRTQKYSASNGFRIGETGWAAPTHFWIDVMYWSRIFNANQEWIFTSQPLQGLIIDTDTQEYHSNAEQSSHIGTYSIANNEIVAKYFVHHGKIQVVPVPNLSQWPMTIVDYTLTV